MAQWLYLLVVIAGLVLAWRLVARPRLERRTRPVDERLIANRAAASEARERRPHDKYRPDL